MSRNGKVSKMVALVDQFRASRLTQEQSSNEHGMDISVLRYWLAKSCLEADGPGFIQIEGVIQQEFRIVYPSGIELYVPAHTPVAQIHQLIQF